MKEGENPVNKKHEVQSRSDHPRGEIAGQQPKTDESSVSGPNMLGEVLNISSFQAWH